ncbi:MAG: dihydroorotase [Deltaproteobacteria bacterium]|nr:dihydroorotase [Deltaproteobacteria bacterium]
MSGLVIKNGRVLDPSSGIDGLYNVYVMSGRIASVKSISEDTGEIMPGVDVLDAKGLLVIPGMVDAHTHLREPGFEYKETIETGTSAAAAGGFTSILCMANTNPVNDNESVTRYILKKAEGCGANVFPVGAVTMGLKGEKLTEAAELKAAGCVALSDDGMPVASAAVMRRGLEYSLIAGLPVITHAEDPALSSCAVMNEGRVSTLLGLKGIPNAAEDVIVGRDVALAELTGARLHVAHVSTAWAVDIIRNAKKRGVKVTAEASPHHLTLTDGMVAGYDTNAKMNPPLRSKQDADALMLGLKDGTIDCIATDHAPQSPVEKDVEFDKASNGIIGLETAFAVIYGLVESGALTLDEMVSAMTIKPSKVFSLDKGSLKVGASADIALIDLSMKWVVEPDKLKSKSKNTPWLGKTLKGRVVKTFLGGHVVYELEGAK